MELETKYIFSDADWKELEEKFVSSYFPVLQFITENKGSFSEAREVYIEAFLYFTQSVELRGRDYLGKSESLIYSFSRILWLKKLAKRNVDLNLVKHHREFYELDDVFHEIDLLNERSVKVADRLGEIGEPCRTLMMEIIGRNKSFEEVGPRLGFADEERALRRIAGCARKLVELMDGKKLEQTDEELVEGMRYILAPTETEKPGGEDTDFGLTMMSRVISTVRNHATSQLRTRMLREFRDQLLPEDGEALKKFDSTPKSRNMKPLYTLSIAATIAIVVSVLTTLAFSGFVSSPEEELGIEDEAVAVDTLEERVEPSWLERTAFLISEEGYALTAAGNLQKGRVVEVTDYTMKTGKAEVLAVDSLADLALLRLDSTLRSGVPFRLAGTDSKVGDELISLGYFNGKLLFTEARAQLKDDAYDLVGGTNLIPGAPLFSNKGELAGIVTAVDRSGKSADADRIREFLERATDENIDLPGRNGLYYSDLSNRVEKVKPCIFSVKFQV
jgi:hypothetical protein